MSNSTCSLVQSNTGGVDTLKRELHFTKVIYNYKGKTELQIKDSVQLDIDNYLANNPAYKFVNSKSHFNGTGGIEMQLNFELK
jgi:hypothetical protein